MIAAGRVAEDAISSAIVKASEMRPHQKPITEKQQKAWKALAKSFGNDRYYVELPSAREIAEAGLKAMMEEADQLLKNEAVRKAYEHFLLLCELTKERDTVWNGYYLSALFVLGISSGQYFLQLYS